MLRLLLAEDDPDYAHIVGHMLRQSFGDEAAVDHVTRLDDACERLDGDAADGYDCVLLDLHLPDGQGLDLLARVRAAAGEVPVVVLTAMGDDGHGEEAVREGAQDYLLKDRVKATDLHRSIRYAIERNRSAVARRRAEQEVVARVAQQAMLAALGRQALADLAADALLRKAVEMVATTLGVEYAAVLELGDEEGALLLRAGVGRLEGWQALDRVPTAVTTLATRTLERHEPVVVEEVAGDGDAVVGSAASVVIGGRDRPFGAFAAASSEPRRFPPDDLHFVQSVANLLAVALERCRTEDEIRYQALHDSLTGLPNRAMFADRLDVALADLGRSSGHCALLLMDLDRFKEVNDTFGHDVGDRVLQEIAARLPRVVRATDTVARLGGDEFVVVCTHVTGVDEAARVARKVLEALEQPCRVDGVPLRIEGSIGVVVAPEHGADTTTLLKRADIAMYRAKRTRTGLAVYTHDTSPFWQQDPAL